MTAPHADAILDGYRRRLDDELRALPAVRRREIVDEVDAHVRDARAGLTDETDSDLLNILDRLGDPSLFGADARERFGVATRGAAGGREVIALVLLSFGAFFVPLVAPIIGLMVVRNSPAWTEREKRNSIVWALITVVAMMVLLLIVPAIIDRFHGGHGNTAVVIAAIPLLLIPILILVPVVSALLLASALARRRTMDPRSE
jgi:hypothetical protein